MARFNGATWKPISVNHTKNGQDSVRGVVIHIMAGTLAGTDSWFRNPSANASSHFGTGKRGELYQWVDTKDRAWAQADGNRTWLSVENEGKGGDSLTDAQLDRCADVLRWAHEVYGVPLKVASGPGDTGLGWHGMGGSSWGGHTSCPGSKIVAQLPEIVRRAGGKPSGGSAPTGVARYKVSINGLEYGYGAKGSQVTQVGKALVAKGFDKHYQSGPGPNWTDADTKNYQDFQESLGYKGGDADGVPGQTSLKKLLGRLPSASKPKPVEYEPYPGAAYFKKHPRSSLVTRMGQRLVAERCSAYSSGPGPQWTESDRRSYRKWQLKLGYRGSDADGYPGKTSWDKLRVPKD